MSIRIGVLGGAGQVGIELIEVAHEKGALVSAPASSEVDIVDAHAVERWIANGRFDAVVNCAAYTSVDAAEGDRERAFAVNCSGPQNLGTSCAAARIPVIHLSTDFVFDGHKSTPYAEDDEPRPLNVYGASKLAGERAILSCGGDALVLRASWVFSVHRRNFVKAMVEQAATGHALQVVRDQVGGPCGANGIAETLWLLAERIRGTGCRLYHFEATPFVSRHDFAEIIVQEAHAQGLVAVVPQIVGVPTTEKPREVRRPLNSRLFGARVKRDFGIQAHDWRAELTLVLSRLAKHRGFGPAR